MTAAVLLKPIIACARCRVEVIAHEVGRPNRCVDPACPLTAPAGHTMHMSLDHSVEPSQSVAACDCGFEHRVEWEAGFYAEQDLAVAAHWQAINTGAGGKYAGQA